jgi:hypothetical protein
MMKHGVSKWLMLVAAFVAAAATVAPVLWAHDPPEGDPTAAPAIEGDSVVGYAPGAMFAFRDPVTGEMRHHTPAELEALRTSLAAMFDPSTDGYVEIQLEQGTAMVAPEGRYIHGSVAVVEPDGSIKVVCTADPDYIVDLAASVVPVAPSDEGESDRKTAVK